MDGMTVGTDQWSTTCRLILLKHGFGFDARIIGSKIFVLLHFLLHAQQLFLHGPINGKTKESNKLAVRMRAYPADRLSIPFYV